jgi:hypothetical protein
LSSRNLGPIQVIPENCIYCGNEFLHSIKRKREKLEKWLPAFIWHRETHIVIVP